MGLDFVSFDGQHSPYPPDVIEDMCRIASGLNLTVMSRIADGEESTILSYLDRGVQGLVIPNLQNRAEAEAWVKYSFYAPQGLRSAASFRVSMFQTQQSRPQLYAEINAATLHHPPDREHHCGREPGRDSRRRGDSLFLRRPPGHGPIPRTARPA